MSLFLDDNFYALTAMVLFSYLIGSISFGIIIAKLMNLGNLRSIGSGNIGATNVLRTGNKTAAAFTVILDGAKGSIIVIITSYLFGQDYYPVTGIAVFLGHIFPIYYGFKGGKGVATFIGIMLGVNLLIGVLICLTWLLIAIITKKSSLGALGCSIVAPGFLFFSGADEKIPFAIILMILIWWLHKDNIKRLLLKNEPSINLKSQDNK